ncbi:TolC family protein [Thioalkalivibrio sp. ALJT]|uniref:TolC family protein n=1 Tax=Thioalkalivibrio sp. ALJT TaxID=1158146 RepID=UPI000362BD18|nr:TolC family protein [Thioalkalivibrio sp. ALJT]
MRQLPDLADLAREAVIGHPDVRRARLEVEREREGITEARSLRLPQVTASTRSEFQSRLGRNVDVASVNASQRLYDFGEVSSEIERARASVSRVEADLHATREDVGGDALQAAIRMQRHQAMEAIAEEQIESMERIGALAQRRSELGAAARADTRAVESRTQQARLVLADVRADRESARRQLTEFLDVAPGARAGEAFPDDWAATCRAIDHDMLDSAPGVRSAAARQSEARAVRARERASRWPTVSVDFQSDYFFDSDLPNQTESTVLLNVQADLFRGGRNRARERAAELDTGSAAARREAIRAAAARAVGEAATRLDDLDDRIDGLEQRVASLDDLRGLYETQYVGAGTRTLLDVLTAEQEYFQARFDLADARHDWRMHTVRCLEQGGQLSALLELEEHE